MADSFFFTDIDPRAAMKGSRDPLGIVPICSRIGRHLVGNLTTASGSLRGFTTLLLAHAFAEQVEERKGRDSESKVALFLKFEQLAAYCRLVRGDGGFRGIDRATRLLADAKGPRLSARSEDQIKGFLRAGRLLRGVGRARRRSTRAAMAAFKNGLGRETAEICSREGAIWSVSGHLLGPRSIRSA